VKVFITGAGGMVGRTLTEHCASGGDAVFAYDHQSLDIADQEAVAAAFERDRPEAVFNCAAWTDVDACEGEWERAFRINARGPEILAAQCRSIGASLLTISTDFVFDGGKDGFYTQRDDPHPVNAYGMAKLEGERRAQAACARTIVIRTGWIFGAGGNNFLSRVIELARRKERLRAIRDAYGTPTSALDLAKRMRELAARDLPGIYHVVNSGDGASYEEFARAAVAAAGCEADIESVSMDSLTRPAPRPRNSRLRCLLSEAVGLERLPLWRDSLRDFATSTPALKTAV
jgi:dTDP-4-dehydrorhamnose reductase